MRFAFIPVIAGLGMAVGARMVRAALNRTLVQHGIHSSNSVSSSL
jgi:hypothetical protein